MPPGILFGWESRGPGPFGFGSSDRPGPSPVFYADEAPITVIASTGSGKGRDCLVPLLLASEAPAIVVDIKGELSAVCGRRRREMGHRVVNIDPFGIAGGQDRLNPFDLFGLEGAQIDCDAEMIAAQLGDGHEYGSDAFWSDTACGLVSGLIAHAASGVEKRSFAVVRTLLTCDDVDYQLAVLVDKHGDRMHPFAHAELSSYLQISSDKTRPSVLSTARTFLKSLNSASVAACLEDSTYDLKDIVDGAPLDVFITIPPEKVISHAGLLRLLVGTLITAILRRREIPERQTTFLIDEAAQLGKGFGPLLTASTLMRGFGLQLVSVWQDVAQIKGRYPDDWRTILNNSGAILTFGIGHHGAAKDAAEFLGMEAAELLMMKPDEAALSVRGQGVRKISRLNYLEDEQFRGLYDPNPYHGRSRGKGI